MCKNINLGTIYRTLYLYGGRGEMLALNSTWHTCYLFKQMIFYDCSDYSSSNKFYAK